MNKKIKFTTLGISFVSAIAIPTFVVTIDKTIQTSNENKILKKENKASLNPFYPPSKLDKYQTIKWVNIYGSFTARVIAETNENISFGVDLDTMGAVFRNKGAYVYLLKLNKETRKYERMNKIVTQYDDGKYGLRPWHEEGLKDGYREFTLDKQEEDEIYKFQLYIGTTYWENDKVVQVRPSLETNAFKVAKLKKDPNKLPIHETPDWIKKNGSVDFKIVLDDSRKLKISVNLNTNELKLKNGAIVEELIQQKNGEYKKTGRILAKYDNLTYGDKGENGYKEFILDKEEYKDVNYKFQLSIGAGYNENGSIKYVPTFDFKFSTKAKSTDPSTLKNEETPYWIKKYGSASFNTISEDNEKVKFSIDLNTNKAILKSGAIIEELKKDENGEYQKTGRILGYYNLWNNYGRDGLHGKREFTVYRDEFKNANYKFQLSIGSSYDNNGNVIYTPTFEFDAFLSSKAKDPKFLSTEETPNWIKKYGSATFNTISEDDEKVKFSINLNTNKAILKAGAIIEELKQDENGAYQKTGRILGYYNLWNNYGRDGLHGKREFTIYRDKFKNENYKFQLSIGNSYDNDGNVIYTPTFEFDAIVKSK